MQPDTAESLPPPTTSGRKELFITLVEESIPAAGFATVGAFFALAHRTYDDPVGGRTPPPLVPMVHRAQMPEVILAGLESLEKMPDRAWDSLHLNDMERLDSRDVPVTALSLYAGLASNVKRPAAACLGAVMIRKVLSARPGYRDYHIIDGLIAIGVLPRLGEWLADDVASMGCDEARRSLTRECASIVEVVASGHHTHKAAVVAAGVLPGLVSHLRCRQPLAQQQCLNAIGSIAAGNRELRDKCIAAGACDAVAEYISGPLQDTGTDVVCAAASAVAGLVSLEPVPAIDAVLPLLHSFPTLLNHRAAPSFPTNVQAAIHSTGDIVEAHLATSHHTASICGLAPCLAPLLTHGAATATQVAWVMQNIAAGTSDHIQSIIDAGVLPVLLELMSPMNARMSDKMLMVFVNATRGGTPQQHRYFLGIGAVPALLDVVQRYPAELVDLALGALRNMIECSADGERDAAAEELTRHDAVAVVRTLLSNGNAGLSRVRASAVALLHSLGVAEEQ